MPAVVGVVAYGQASAYLRREESGRLRGAGVHEMAVAGVAIELFGFGVVYVGMIAGDVVEDVAIDDQEIAPAVVIEIEETRAEAAIEDSWIGRCRT